MLDNDDEGSVKDFFKKPNLYTIELNCSYKSCKIIQS